MTQDDTLYGYTRKEHEYRVRVPKMLLPQFPEPSIVIYVSKHGGGTVGQAYTGSWDYLVTVSGKDVISGRDLHTGTPKTHDQAAREVASWLAFSENAPERFAEGILHDRLSLFADDDE